MSDSRRCTSGVVFRHSVDAVYHSLPVDDALVGVDAHLSVVVPDRSISGTLASRHTRVVGRVHIRVLTSECRLRPAVRPLLITVAVVSALVSSDALAVMPYGPVWRTVASLVAVSWTYRHCVRARSHAVFAASHSVH